jgi:predicted O-methyltransferase YrrM
MTFNDFTIKFNRGICNQDPKELWGLIEMLQSHFPDGIKNMLEVGVEQGGTGFILSELLKDGSKYVGIDLFVQNKDKDRYSKKAMVSFIEKDSGQAYKDLENTTFDFIYIDADHNEDSVYLDIKNYINYLNKNGVMAFHDYSYDTGVKKAIERAIEDKIISFSFSEIFPGQMNTFYFIKD